MRRQKWKTQMTDDNHHQQKSHRLLHCPKYEKRDDVECIRIQRGNYIDLRNR